MATRVGHDHQAAGVAQHVLVVSVFEAAHSFLVNIDVAEHMRSQVALRIKALIFLLEIDPRQFGLLDRRRFGGIQLAPDPDKGPVAP